ncbi:hypothetical protein M1146_06245 [Patescibacteria group bacterium]|nr:hypothetical protein [Patescibacteria group bacterium]
MKGEGEGEVVPQIQQQNQSQKRKTGSSSSFFLFIKGIRYFNISLKKKQVSIFDPQCGLRRIMLTIV